MFSWIHYEVLYISFSLMYINPRCVIRMWFMGVTVFAINTVYFTLRVYQFHTAEYFTHRAY